MSKISVQIFILNYLCVNPRPNKRVSYSIFHHICNDIQSVSNFSLQSSLFEALSYTLNGNEGKGPWAKSFHLSELAPTRFLLYLRLTCLFVLSAVFFLSSCVYPRPSKLFPESVFLHIHTNLQPRKVRTEVL